MSFYPWTVVPLALSLPLVGFLPLRLRSFGSSESEPNGRVKVSSLHLIRISSGGPIDLPACFRVSASAAFFCTVSSLVLIFCSCNSRSMASRAGQVLVLSRSLLVSSSSDEVDVSLHMGSHRYVVIFSPLTSYGHRTFLDKCSAPLSRMQPRHLCY